MKDNIVNYNLSIIYEHPNSIFVANEEGKLDTISSFNVVGRLIEWIKDVRSGKERSTHTHKVLIHTLEKVVENVEQKGYFCFSDPDRLQPTFSLTGLCYALLRGCRYERLPVYKFRYYHPIDALADKILGSSLNKKSDIRQLAKQIKESSIPLLQALSESRRQELFEKPFNV